MSHQLTGILKATCDQGVDSCVFPGISVGISVYNGGEYRRLFAAGGQTRLDKPGSPISLSTSFDVASLTKPLCTALCVYALVANKKIHWTTPVLPLFSINLPADKERIEVGDLLAHCSGFPPYKPLYKQFMPNHSPCHHSSLMEMVMQEPLIYSPGGENQYSDFDFILLGRMIEAYSGMGLNTFFKETIQDELGFVEELGFRPHEEGGKALLNKSTAATEFCAWRQRMIHGEVHDEHCWLMGGVAGHAGLFATVGSVGTLCERLLDLWKGRSANLGRLTSEILKEAMETRWRNLSWCLGFDRPTHPGSSTGKYFSSQSVGHLGFSGTSFWIDPEQEVIVVMLTNRIHPSRNNNKIREYRPWFHDIVMSRIVPSLK